MSWVSGGSRWRTDPLVPPATRERILREFRALFLSQTSERSLKKTVKRDSGQRLCVGVPRDWWLRLTPRGELMEMDGKDLRPLLPTEEWAVVLGELHAPTASHTSLYLAMGRESRIFVYSALEDALTLAANDLDEFSRIGLSVCEFVFRIPAPAPAPSSRSSTTVADALWNALCACATAADLSKTVARLRRDVLRVRTPCKLEDAPLILLDGFELCRDYWPLCALSRRRFEETARYLSERLCCGWHPLGLVGNYKNSGVFHATYLIVFDDRRVLYYLSLCAGEAWRLADDVADFRKLGLLKVFTGGRRVDRDWVGPARLERPPDPSLWFHSRREALHLCPDVCPPGENQLGQ